MSDSASTPWDGNDGMISSSEESLVAPIIDSPVISTPLRQSTRNKPQESPRNRSLRQRGHENNSQNLDSNVEILDADSSAPSRLGQPTDALPAEVAQSPADRSQTQINPQYSPGRQSQTIDLTSPSKPRTVARRASAKAKRGPIHSTPAVTSSDSRDAPEVSGEPSLADHSRPSGPLSPSRSYRRSSSNRGRYGMAHSHFKNSPDEADLSFSFPSPYTYFPTFRGCARYDGFVKQHEDQQFFDCKFYPYTEPGVDPIFAVVGGTDVIVARPVKSDKEPLEVIMWQHEKAGKPPGSATSALSSADSYGNRREGKHSASKSHDVIFVGESEAAELNSCAWLREPDTRAPMLAVAGSKPSAIKIIDVVNQKLHRTLEGHGKEVNDLAVSPLDASMLASASGDHSVRVWSIDSKYERQPCLLMCVGEGHKQAILTLAYHQKGNYLLTGGVDCAVCLWALPQLPDERSGTDKPTMVHYPHFKSTAIHCSFVDCVAFYHDLILSKSAIENKIVLWRIEGFDSRDDPPTKAPNNLDGSTRSAFGGKYQRIIQFGVPDTSSFYIRFSLFSAPSQRPILAIGNEKSRVFFWDMDTLEEFARYEAVPEGNHLGSAVNRGGRPSKRRGGGGGSGNFVGGGGVGAGGGRGRRSVDERHSSVFSESSNSRSDNVNPFGVTSADKLGIHHTGGRQKIAERYRMNDPFQTLEAHKISAVQKVNFACRQVAWSVAGEYMVVVGDQGMIALFSRDLVWDR